jgi:hypothetical protein
MEVTSRSKQCTTPSPHRKDARTVIPSAPNKTPNKTQNKRNAASRSRTTNSAVPATTIIPIRAPAMRVFCIRFQLIGAPTRDSLCMRRPSLLTGRAASALSNLRGPFSSRPYRLRFQQVCTGRYYAVATATFAAILVATKFLMRRRVRSTNASLSAKQLSSRTPTA